LPAKIEAALERNCRIVIIQRPVEAGAGECRGFTEIVQAVSGFDESVQQDIFNIPSRIDDR
jgi:precorrin-6x reductase